MLPGIVTIDTRAGLQNPEMETILSHLLRSLQDVCVCVCVHPWGAFEDVSLFRPDIEDITDVLRVGFTGGRSLLKFFGSL